MPQRHRAAVQVHLLLAQPQQFQVGERDDGESLVDLEGVDVLGRNAGVGQRLGDGERGRRGEFARFLRGVAPAHDARDGLQVVGLHEGFRDENEGGGAVGERGRVGRRDGSRAVGDECGLHAAKLLFVQRHAGFLVLVDRGGRFPPRAGDLDGGDLGGEEAGLGGVLGFLDGADGVGVLVGAGDVVVFAAFFGLETHVLGGVCVGEAVLQEAVDQSVIAVFGSFAEGGKVMGDVGHGLGPAG